MTLTHLGDLLQKDAAFADAISYTETSADFIVSDGLRSPLIAQIYADRRREGKLGALLVITASSRDAQLAEQNLKTLIPGCDSVTIPAWETLPHERHSPSSEAVGQRMAAFAKLRDYDGSRPLLVCVSVRAALQAVSPFTAAASAIKITVGSELGDLAGFAEKLVELGYERSDMVTKRGDFALRGGIIDIFVPTASAAVRIDCFGDEVESLHEFAVSEQRSAEAVAELQIWPARELLLTPQVTATAQQLLQADHPEKEMLAKLAAGVPVPGMEALLPQLVEKQFAVTELLRADSMTAVFAPERVASRAVSLAETNAEFLTAAWGAAQSQADKPIAVTGGETGLFTLEQVRQLRPDLTWHTLSGYGLDSAEDSSDATESGSYESTSLRVIAENIPAAVHDPLSHAIELITGWLERRAAAQTPGVAVVVAQSEGAAKRATELLAERGVPVVAADNLPVDLTANNVYVVRGEIASGFILETAGLLVISESEFFGRNVSALQGGSTRPKRRRAKNVVDPLQLKAGDYVVHDVHGIGRFVALTERAVPGSGGARVKREFLVLEYAPSKRGMPADKLFVPTDQLAQLSKYVGGEAPVLSKMGGSDWADAKKKARKAVRELAVELVKLYSARAHAEGFAFSPDTVWQRELEESFPYVETADQLTAIADVKRDMERARPMDRLISGDVGFGKTEIAVRAAFKAVQDNKQVAILVPTTLLVKQHFATFQARFAGFPVRLKALSRFQSDAEAKDILEQLAIGGVDVVIGTHRLLGKNVKYRDLGLIIIDEEQRFGVEHKEILKDMKRNVDVLSMSATPIPRTLEMAVTGIREMSSLATAPEDRLPILTFVGQRNDAQTAAAIRREMLRDGQIFYVHNRVSSIHRVAKRIADSVPEARVAVAHGKLGQAELERVVVDFYERKYDVLVCTTIVETGLDIANANTIIIDNADKYGLSQLHQLRGRVGRGRDRAYAYFLYEPGSQLTEQAYERLETIATHNELGSGMQVALKDLELRGAGNLLGGEQSGHIAGVGFDLYLRMIGEAVETFKGQSAQDTQQLNLVLPVAARIPEQYIDSERLRLEAYQKFAAAAHPQAQADHVQLVLDELADRYGPPPVEVLELAGLSRLRRSAVMYRLSELKIVAGKLKLTPVTLPESRQMRLQRLYPGASYRGGELSVPVPAAALEGGAKNAASPFARDVKAADRALDGDLISWVYRVLESLLGDK